MIEEARGFDVLYNAPHVLIFPGVAIALTVLAFNFIGDGLRENTSTRNRGQDENNGKRKVKNNLTFRFPFSVFRFYILSCELKIVFSMIESEFSSV
jgi:hypothetical protein